MTSSSAAQTPNHKIQDRSEIDALTTAYIAKHGEPRRFPRGFSSDWGYLQHLMSQYVYEVRYTGKGFYSMTPGPSQRRLDRAGLLGRVDAVLIANGRQPFVRRDG